MIGKRLGQYEIVAQLGAGGMAVVYRAHQSRIDRDVAIKVIKPERQEATEFIKRFQREAKTIASLSHPILSKFLIMGKMKTWSTWLWNSCAVVVWLICSGGARSP